MATSSRTLRCGTASRSRCQASEHGGRVEWSSDSFYSDARVLIASDRPRNMGDGWETRRRRDIGPDTHDAVMISFAVPADLQRVEIDTSRFVFKLLTRGGGAWQPRAAMWRTRLGAGAVLTWKCCPPTPSHPMPDRSIVVDATDITALLWQAYPERWHCSRPGLRAPHRTRAFSLLQVQLGGVRRDEHRADDRMQRTVAAHCAHRQRRVTRHEHRSWHGCRASPRTRTRAASPVALSQHDYVFEWQRLIDIQHTWPVPRRGANAVGGGGAHRGRCARVLTSNIGCVTTALAARAGDCSCIARSCCVPVRNSDGLTCAVLCSASSASPQWTVLNPHMNCYDLVANGVPMEHRGQRKKKGEVDL